MPTQPLLSVIVPVYNAAPYLRRCLDSICGQTYPNLEIILIDDGSTDSSLEICKQYAAKDPRVRVIHQANKGLPATRNVGIEQSKGEFFTFVDSDDWVDTKCYQLLLQQLLQTQADLVCCDFFYAFDQGLKKRSFTEKIPTEKLRFDQFLLILLNQRNPYTWNKIYRRSWVGQIRFDPRYTVLEDWYFVSRLALQGGKMAHVPVALYFYYQRSQSMIHASSSTQWCKAFELSQELYQKFQSGPFAQLKKALLGHLLALASALSLMALLEQPGNWAHFRKARAVLRQYVGQILQVNSMGLLGKIFALSVVLLPKTTAWGCQFPAINKSLKRAFAKRTM